MKILIHKLSTSGLLGAVLLLAALATQPAAAATRSFTFTADLIGDIRVLAPEGEPQAFVFLISDSDGVTAQRVADAEALVARGAAVALVDLTKFIAKQAASDDVDCHYAFGDLEDAARVAERQLGMTTWRQPIMLGYGDGGTRGLSRRCSGAGQHGGGLCQHRLQALSQVQAAVLSRRAREVEGQGRLLLLADARRFQDVGRW